MIKSTEKYFELTFWIVAIMALGLSNPGSDSHFSLCPFKLVGFKWCPGCGIGHAIAYLLHGNIKSSLHAHWLGIPALAVILYRICNLFRLRLSKFNRLKTC